MLNRGWYKQPCRGGLRRCPVWGDKSGAGCCLWASVDQSPLAGDVRVRDPNGQSLILTPYPDSQAADPDRDGDMLLSQVCR